MNKKMRVCFYLRGKYQTKEGTTPIQTRLYLRNERIDMGSTNCYIVADLWDKEKGRAKGRSLQSRSINQQLDHIEADLMHIFRRYEFADNLSLDLIKAKYLGKDEEDTKQWFLVFYDEFIGEIKKEVGICRAYASIEKHVRVRNRFADFIKLQYKRKDGIKSTGGITPSGVSQRISASAEAILPVLQSTTGW